MYIHIQYTIYNIYLHNMYVNIDLAQSFIRRPRPQFVDFA